MSLYPHHGDAGPLPSSADLASLMQDGSLMSDLDIDMSLPMDLDLDLVAASGDQAFPSLAQHDLSNPASASMPQDSSLSCRR